MRWISLVRLPGNGEEQIEVNDSWTVSRLIQENSLNNRSIMLDGVEVPASSYSVATLAGVGQIVAVGATKGNEPKR